MTIFDIIQKGLFQKKIQWKDIPEQDKKQFSDYMTLRWLSMNLDYTELINVIQKYITGVQTKENTFKLLQSILPKQSFFQMSYTKKDKEKGVHVTKEGMDLLVSYFEVSSREILLYIKQNNLTLKDIIDIFKLHGYTDKEIKKLIK